MKQSAGKFKKIGSIIEPLLKANIPDWRKNQNDLFSLWTDLVGEKISRNEICPASSKKYKNCCGAL